MKVFKVEYRRIGLDEHQYQGFILWNELGQFGNIKLAMQAIVHEMNDASDTNFTLEQFERSNIGQVGHEIYYLKGSFWQFRFLLYVLPDSPWKIGLNDV